MPGHRTHDIAAYIAAPGIVLALNQVTTMETALTVGAAFLVANHYLSPDLDIDSIMNRRWGFLAFVWYPYKKLFHHRSFWTHSGPISATIRFIYLAVWISPLIIFVQPPSLSLIVLLYIGMVLADSLHTLLDKLL